MGGSRAQGQDCPANFPVSRSRWVSKRLVYDQARGTNPYTPPTVLTAFLEADAPYQDPAVAIVQLGGIASVRNLPVPAAQVDPRTVDIDTATGQPAVPQTSNTPVAPGTSSTRGPGTPQWLVNFSAGDNVRQSIFVDGGCVLTLPARTVSIYALTQILFFPPTDGDIANPTVTVFGGLVTEAFVTAGVSWSKHAMSSAPAGMATYSQTAFFDNVTPTQPLFFSRPPFARRARMTPPIAVAGTWSGVANLAGVLQTVWTPPPGPANAGEPLDVPHNVAALVFNPTPPGVGNAIANVVWELGVR